MPTTTHNVTVTIDGRDRSSSLLYDALSVRVGVGNATSVADLTVEETQGYSPQPWDEVIVAVGATRLFGGFVVNRDAAGVGVGAARRVRWQLACRDWSALLDKLVVTASYSQMTDAAIVTQLINTYLVGNGFTLARVDLTRYGVSVGFDRMTLRAALNKVADQVGAAWYIDSLKNFYWYNRWAPPRAAFDIDTSSPNNTTTFDVLAGSLRRQIDDAAAINRVVVYGADVQGALRTETFTATASGDEYEFGPLAVRPHSVVSVVASFTGLTNLLIRPPGIGYEPDAVPMGTPNVDTGRWRTVVVNRDQRTLKIRIGTGAGSLPLPSSLVTVTYYEAAPMAVTVDDADLQALHGRVLEQQVYDPTIADVTQATGFARDLLATYGRGRETLAFDVPEFGLLPGTEVNVYSPELGITPVVQTAKGLLQEGSYWLLESGDDLLWEAQGVSVIGLAQLESGDELLLEDGGFLRLETAAETGRYIVQEVTYRPVHTPTGWMLVASCTVGERLQTLVDLVSKLAGGAGVGGLPASMTRSQLSDVASDLGVVVAGRAQFTDGGTAAYGWATPNQHTGVVVGLDDSGTPAAGALVIYQAGTARLKLGQMAGLAPVGSVTPTGWGIWTDNGYFTGQVAGGTVAGAVVRTSGSAISSQNPGVQMDPTGLYGYGTAGLTFYLPTDPAQRPIFSSGTILNTVYEVTTASVLRTGTVNPRIQIDNSGIFAYNAAGAQTFSVNAATGLLTAVGGSFSGSVSASTITGGTVSGGVISGGTITGARVSAGTVSGNLISGGTITGTLSNQGTISAGVLSGALVTGGTVSAAGGSVTIDDGGLTLTRYSSFTANATAVQWKVSGSLAAFIQCYEYSGENWLGISASVTRISGDLYIDSYVRTSLVPSQSNWQALGDATHAWRYLFLFDGTDEWRLAINSSGVVSATKV